MDPVYVVVDLAPCIIVTQVQPYQTISEGRLALVEIIGNLMV